MVRHWRGTLKQPFAIKLFSGVWNAHPRFATRTVLVKNNDVDAAFSLLNSTKKGTCLSDSQKSIFHFSPRISLWVRKVQLRCVLIPKSIPKEYPRFTGLMDSEGLLKLIRRTQYYQKPYMQRQQLSIEASNAIFNEDMTRKMQFMMRKNRPDAYPGQMTT